jgi:zinc/manganese transport system substrate-binding protein
MRKLVLLTVGSLLALVPAAAPAGATRAPRVLQVVAAENFWGSLAAQLGGQMVRVTSIVTDPNADPHEYESNPADARLFAAAALVIVNGAGYDSWADKLLAADVRPGRRVLDVASLLHVPDGSNPHLWYDPQDVGAVVNAITATYETMEPAERRYFTSRHATVELALGGYRSTLAALRSRFAGTPVGSTESIFVYMARALGLRLVTPPAFMNAVSEGVDPPVGALITFQHQIAKHQLAVLVYNTQTVTPLTDGLVAAAKSRHIPVVPVSETMVPPNSTFERWMVGELDRLRTALAQAHAR